MKKEDFKTGQHVFARDNYSFLGTPVPGNSISAEGGWKKDKMYTVVGFDSVGRPRLTCEDGTVCFLNSREYDHFYLAGKENTAATSKETNPKDAVGIRKAPYSTVPALVINEVGLAMLEGACKYGRHNYREAGIRTSVYYDATRRHLDDFWEGLDIDPDSGLHNVTKAIACLIVMRDAMINEKITDDRPPKTKNIAEQRERLNVLAGQILDKYPDPKPAYTEVK